MNINIKHALLFVGLGMLIIGAITSLLIKNDILWIIVDVITVIICVEIIFRFTDIVERLE